MNRRNFVKAAISLLLVIPLLHGCAGPAKYDVSKFGTIQKVGILGFSENEIEFWADIDRSSNMYSSAGANDSKARRFTKLLKDQLKDFYPTLQNSISATLHDQKIDSTLIPVPRDSAGIAESRYTSIDQPLLLECKVHIGFVLVNGGIMPTATVFYRIVETNGPSRLEKHLSIGYGKPSPWMEAEIIDFPKKLYPNEKYVVDHSSEIANDLLSMASPLGKATAQSLLKSTR